MRFLSWLRGLHVATPGEVILLFALVTCLSFGRAAIDMGSNISILKTRLVSRRFTSYISLYGINLRTNLLLSHVSYHGEA